MAKLSAYGQRELYRITRERDRPLDETISWERIERAVMHNGRILEKRTVIFRDPSLGRHNWGWKLKGHLKPDWTPEAFVRLMTGPLKDNRPSPWTLTKGTLLPRVEDTWDVSKPYPDEPGPIAEGT